MTPSSHDPSHPPIQESIIHTAKKGRPWEVHKPVKSLRLLSFMNLTIPPAALDAADQMLSTTAQRHSAQAGEQRLVVGHGSI